MTENSNLLNFGLFNSASGQMPTGTNDVADDDGHFDIVRFVYSVSGWGSLALGLPLNLLLIWLILNKTVQAMKLYARVLLCSTILDLILILVASTVQPILIADHGYRMLIQNGIFRKIPEPYGLIVRFYISSLKRLTCLLDSIWIQLIVCFNITTTLQYVFRYLLTTRDSKLPCSLIWRLIGLWALGNILHYIVMIAADWPRPEHDAIIAEMTIVLTRETGIKDIQIASFSVGRSFPWYVHAAFMIVLYFGCYGTILFCSIKIRKYVNEQARANSMADKKLRELNRQIGLALLIQAILPTFELIAFTMKVCLPIFFTTETVFYIIYTAVPLYYIPVLNPLGTILVVKPYRRYLFAILKFGRVDSTTITANNIVLPISIMAPNNGECSALPKPSSSMAEMHPEMTPN